MRPPTIRCRPIRDEDLSDVADLLARGFPKRARETWRSGLELLKEWPEFSDYPRYGHLLVVNGRPAGVILTIYSKCEEGDEHYVRCNVSSWFVEPEYSSYASLLNSAATRRSEVTYLNVSAARHTHGIVEALGFRPLCAGIFVTAPLLMAPRPRARVVPYRDAGSSRPRLSESEDRIMADHANFGCISVVCDLGGDAHPFVFYRSRLWGERIPCLHLGYCRNLRSFSDCVGSLGRAFGLRMPLISLDADGPVPGLRGIFRARGNKFYKGSVKPRLGDLAYVEDAVFG